MGLRADPNLAVISALIYYTILAAEGEHTGTEAKDVVFGVVPQHAATKKRSDDTRLTLCACLCLGLVAGQRLGLCLCARCVSII